MKRTRKQAGMKQGSKKGNTKKRRVTVTKRYRNPYPDGMGMEFDGMPSTTLRTRNLSVVPRESKIKLKYCERYTSDAASQYGYQIFRMNSLFDPNYAFGGHQPNGFDQWAALYKRYLVTGCKIEVTMVNTADPSSAAAPRCVFMYPTYESDLVFDFTKVLEYPQVSYDYVSGIAGESMKRIKMYVPLHTFFGKTKSQYKAENNNSALMGNNPVSDAFIYIGTQTLVPDLEITNFAMVINLTYYCTMYEPAVLAQS